MSSSLSAALGLTLPLVILIAFTPELNKIVLLWSILSSVLFSFANFFLSTLPLSENHSSILQGFLVFWLLDIALLSNNLKSITSSPKIATTSPLKKKPPSPTIVATSHYDLRSRKSAFSQQKEDILRWSESDSIYVNSSKETIVKTAEKALVEKKKSKNRSKSRTRKNSLNPKKIITQHDTTHDKSWPLAYLHVFGIFLHLFTDAIMNTHHHHHNDFLSVFIHQMPQFLSDYAVFRYHGFDKSEAIKLLSVALIGGIMGLSLNELVIIPSKLALFLNGFGAGGLFYLSVILLPGLNLEMAKTGVGVGLNSPLFLGVVVFVGYSIF